MSEKKTALTEADSSKKGAPAKPAKKNHADAVNKPSGKSGNKRATFALVLSFITLVGAAYTGWKSHTLEQVLPSAVTRIQQVDGRLSLQTNQLAETQGTITSVRQKTNNLEQQNERLLARVDQLSDQVRNLEGTTMVDWHLAEVEYLLRLANQRLLMTSDFRGARQLLTSADEVLQSIDDFNLFNVRQILAEDIAALNAVPVFNQENVYMKIQALDAQIPLLQLLEVDRFKPVLSKDTEAPAKVEATDNHWKTTLKAIMLNAWEGFTGLFRFTTSRERPVDVLLTPEQDTIVRQNLRLLLEQSKLALLTRQSTIYKNALAQAKVWIKTYFARNNTTNQSFIRALQALAAVDIHPKLPRINRALSSLKHIQLHAIPKKEQEEQEEQKGQKGQQQTPSPDAHQKEATVEQKTMRVITP
ncbi:uroporphyrinogen-III C-methyltransferase [Candidatus Sororendozoicomonas aggregata]|uniref:uroporphyrinogen-III C-methyltransferase n=1 Tax=Candidatus Sororendozoicomonas aggregata TaxID=3073239 RepID=UPI002ED5A4F3